MEWNNKIPEWKNEGTEPSDDRKQKGFESGYKPPAGIFNWFWSLVSKAITELQTIVSNLVSHAENKNNPHGVTKAQLGLDKVDNTPDSQKSVNFASEAGVGRKVKNSLTLRFKGGSTEGTDMWTYDGSTGKSINITPEKIGASKSDHRHTLDGIDETGEKKINRIVAATSTDGVDYTATVDDLTGLQNGIEITIIPNINNSTKNPTLNINGLGAVKIYRPLSFATFVANAPEVGFMRANTPCRLMYHENYVSGGIWLMADKVKYSAQDLYGKVPVQSGGLAIDSNTTNEDKETALENLQNIGVNWYRKVTATFDGLGWDSQSDGTYQQTLTVNGVTASSNIFVAPSLDFVEVYEAMGCKVISLGTNTVTFSCYNLQDVDLSVNIIILTAENDTDGSIFGQSEIGAAKIARGSYVGTGTSGVDNPNTLTFGFTPSLVFVDMEGFNAGQLVMLYGVKFASHVVLVTKGEEKHCEYEKIPVEWSSNGVSWYHQDKAASQHNVNGTKYVYVAFG